MSAASDPEVSAERERALIAAARREASELAKGRLASLPPAGSVPGYTLVRELGRGGMGIVYEAKQQHTQRVVALKMIRAGAFVDDHRVRLFAREVQTLARLRHPAIATIYEAGRTDNGDHFFAMELVRGGPLTEYVRLERPPLRDRLQLFGRICEAIHYAHQRGVIHRDLKPSNIIIDTEGHPKILDFGLARITDSDVTITATSTEIGKIMGTLPYMSPEQARGRPDEIDVRSDVYSLGVILYELLTGQLPYGLDTTAPHEFLRVICEQTPRRPSTISRALRGDLETIVLKALAKEPSRRYHSAAALGDDTDRYLMRQPVLARPPSTAYQLRKLVARHKLASAFVAALSVLVAGFGIWMSVLYAEADAAHAAERGQRRLAEANLAHAQEAERRAAAEAARAKHERDRAVGAEQLATQRLSESRAAHRQAERQRENAKRIQEFLEGTIASADPYSNQGAPTFRDMLDGAGERVGTTFTAQPAAAASIHDTLGLAYARAGWYEPAEHHLRAALAIRQQLFGDEHLDVADSLAHLSFHLSHCRWLGNPHRDPHEYEEAMALCERALAIRRQLLGEDHARTLEARAYLGYLHHWAGDFAAADEAMITVSLMGLRSQVGAETLGQLMGQGLRVMRAWSPAHDLAVAEKMAHALMHGGLGILRGLWSSGQHEAARRFVRLFYGPFINDPQLGEAVPWTMALFAERRMLCGDYDTAEPILHEAIEASRARFGAGAQFYVAWNLENLALVLRARGDLPGAEDLLREVLAMRRALLGGNHPQVAVTLERLAGALMEQRKFAAAEALFRECRDIRRDTLGPTHWLTAYTESLLGGCLTRLGRYELAEPLLVESYPFIREDRGEQHERTAEALNRIVDLYEALGEAEKAAEYRALLSDPPG